MIDKYCANQLDGERDDDDIAQGGEDLRHAIVGVDEVFDEHLALRRMFASKHQTEEGGERHDADASQLNEHQEDDVALGGERSGDVDSGQAGDSHGTGGRE